MRARSRAGRPARGREHSKPRLTPLDRDRQPMAISSFVPAATFDAQSGMTSAIMDRTRRSFLSSCSAPELSESSGFSAKKGHEIFDIVFTEQSLFRKINDGCLSSEIAAETGATNPTYAGLTSSILKHFSAVGKHVATTHRIGDAVGNTVHWHGKDLLIDDIRMVRQP